MEYNTFKVPMSTRVRVVNCPKYKGTLNGEMAIVVNGEYSEVRIAVDSKNNYNAVSGHFYVSRHHLEVEMPDGKFINLKSWLRMPPEQKFNTERNITMIGNYTVVKAKYIDNVQEAMELTVKAENDDGGIPEKGQYEFACFDQYIKIGDTVLVQSAHHGFGLAVVISARTKTPEDDNSIVREVISYVNMEAYNERIEARRRAAELKEQMKQRAKALQDIALYEQLAAGDPEMAEMLRQFKSLA